MLVRVDIEKNSPVPNASPKGHILTFEPLDVSSERTLAHVLEGSNNSFPVFGWNAPKPFFCGPDDV
ncbi:MAG: hypothetical protein ACR2L2_15970 [Acidobacteriota bacterium]